MVFSTTKQSLLHDEVALEQMVKELYPKIYAYVYRRIYNEAIAKDITQETFCKFFARIDQYQEQGKVLHYLYRIAYHVLVDYTNDKQKNLPLLEAENIPDDTSDSHQHLMKKEQITILRKWILQLPEQLQEVLLLRYEEGLKYKEISTVTGVHVSTVKSRVQLAISILQDKEKEESLR